MTLPELIKYLAERIEVEHDLIFLGLVCADKNGRVSVRLAADLGDEVIEKIYGLLRNLEGPSIKEKMGRQM